MDEASGKRILDSVPGVCFASDESRQACMYRYEPVPGTWYILGSLAKPTSGSSGTRYQYQYLVYRDFSQIGLKHTGTNKVLQAFCIIYIGYYQ